VDLLTGAIYAGLGSNLLTAYIIFACISFIGVLLFLLAHHHGFGRLNKFHAGVLLFAPSVVYFTAMVGKEAVILLGCGLVTYGASSLVEARSFRWLPSLLGLSIVFFIRPAMGVVVCIALLAGVSVTFRVRRFAGNFTVHPRPGRTLLLVGCLTGFVMLAAFQNYYNNNGYTWSSLDRVEERLERDFQGGSAIDQPSSVYHLPLGVVTVLTRPWPWEAHNLPALLASIEMLGLVFLVTLHRKGLIQVLREAPSSPLIAYALVAALLLVLLFATTGNLGTLARHRSLLIPFLWIHLCRAHHLSEVRFRPPFR
jgi:hypothetical protein